jgi:hypothetical protein
MNATGSRALARFGQFRLVWRLRNGLLRARLFALGRAFRLRYAAADTVEDVSAVRALLNKTVGPVLLGVGLVAICAVFNHTRNDVARWLEIGNVTPSAYDVLLQTVAGTTGVFLALYFTAVSSVAATVYATVPHDIRSLVVRDRLGNVYVNVVAFTMATSVGLLVVRATSGTQYFFILPVLGVLAVFSIFAFIRLGQRAFYLADPTLLAATLTSDFTGWLKRCRYGGWRWDDPTFQAHYRFQARRQVASLTGLMEIASRQAHLRGASVQQLAARMATLLTGYLSSSAEIPTASRWFGERYEHKQWYLADSTELELATNTASALQPRTIPDSNWVEYAITSSIIGAIDRSLREASLEDAYVSSEALLPIARALGAAWSTDEGIRITRRFGDAVIPNLVAHADASIERPALVPGLTDLLASFPMWVELGLHGIVVDLDIPNLASRLERTDWTDPGAPYRLQLPRRAVETLETITAGARFEDAADVSQLSRTPGWYSRELALNSLEWALYEDSGEILAFLASWYPATADTLTEAGLHDAAGAVLSRALEATWKLERHVAQWQALVETLQAIPHRLDLVRPTWDWAGLAGSVRDLNVAILERLASSIPTLAEHSRDSGLPDFLGHAVHRSGEACFEALRHDDADLFEALFPRYLLGIFVVFDRLRPEVQNWRPQQAMTWMSEPILDAMALSGHALMYSELHGDPRPWAKCQATWRVFVEGAENTQRLSAMAAMHNHSRHLFAISPRSVLRTRWQMALGQDLEQLPRSTSSRPWDEGQVQHDSALIRRITPSGGFGMMMMDPGDLFVERYLKGLPGAEHLDFGVADWVAQELEADDEHDAESEYDGA